MAHYPHAENFEATAAKHRKVASIVMQRHVSAGLTNRDGCGKHCSHMRTAKTQTNQQRFSWVRVSFFLFEETKYTITKTRLFKYIKNFTIKKRKLSDEKFWQFSHFC